MEQFDYNKIDIDDAPNSGSNNQTEKVRNNERMTVHRINNHDFLDKCSCTNVRVSVILKFERLPGFPLVHVRGKLLQALFRFVESGLNLTRREPKHVLAVHKTEPTLLSNSTLKFFDGGPIRRRSSSMFFQKKENCTTLANDVLRFCGA